MFRKFAHTIVVPGTLSAPVQYTATMPSACTIQQVSMVQSNAGNGRAKMGLSTDDDTFLIYTEMGQTNVPVVLEDEADFRSSVRPHLAAGDILKFYIDHDGASGTAADDVTVVITFTEG